MTVDVQKFINEKKKLVKKPKILIFMDIDGTTNLEDEKFKKTINVLRAKGAEIVPVTGRSIGDIRQKFIKNHLEEPIFYSGDNGTVIYFNESAIGVKEKARKGKIRELLDKNKNTYKILFPKDKMEKIIEYYLDHGGNPDLIRATTQDRVLASGRTEDVVDYCDKHAKGITTYYDNIEDQLGYIEDITKVTLAGNKELMKEVQKFATSLGLNTDADSTKFPNKEDKNWRLDISEANKANAVSIISQIMNPELGYMCIGNGRNDIPMLKKTIDDDMLGVIVSNSPKEIFDEINMYKKIKGKGIVEEKSYDSMISGLFDLVNKLVSYRKQKDKPFRKNYSIEYNKTEKPAFKNNQTNIIKIPDNSKTL